MGKKIFYKCPKCGKQHIYESRYNFLPKRPRTTCKTCRSKIYVKQNNAFGVPMSKSKLPLKKSFSQKPPQITPGSAKSAKIPQVRSKPKVVNLTRSSKNSKKIFVVLSGVKGDFTDTRSKKLTKLSKTPADPTWDLYLDQMYSGHRYRFTFQLLQDCHGFHWDKTTFSEKGARSFFNTSEYTLEKTNYCLIIGVPHHFYADDPNDAMDAARIYAQNIAKKISQRGFKLSTSCKDHKEHICLPKNAFPTIRKLGASKIVRSRDGTFTIDDSPEEGDGEIEISGLDQFNKLMSAANENVVLRQEKQQLQEKVAELEKLLQKQQAMLAQMHSTTQASHSQKQEGF